MNCDDAKFYVGLPDSDPRAVEMRAHIRACAMCRAEVDHQNNVRATFGLLRYEQPPADFSAQCVTRIMRAVQEQSVNAPSVTWWAAWREQAATMFQPLRLAAAAVLMLSLGFYFLQGPHDGTAVGPASAHVVIHSEPPALVPAAVPVPLAPVMLAASNSGPMRMDYGPGGAVPVKFEY
ncbi:MAG: hypothetical protein NTY53_07350 [Kiritimatiellaeota bacterium]|nr:hypothetical protein [Kiritimatiellota bacterium]